MIIPSHLHSENISFFFDNYLDNIFKSLTVEQQYKH